MRSIRTLLITILLFCSCSILNAGGGELFSPTGKQYHTGIVIRLETGEEILATGNIIMSHRALVNNILNENAVDGKKPGYLVLWAGEIESIDGKVARLNETAGIVTREKQVCLEGLSLKGAGIKSFKDFLLRNPGLAKYFSSTDYIEFDKKEVHLEKGFELISDFRHDVQGLFGALDFESVKEMYKEGHLDGEFIDSWLKKVSQKAIKLLEISESLKPVVAELNTRGWFRIEKDLRYISRLAANGGTAFFMNGGMDSYKNWGKDVADFLNSTYVYNSIKMSINLNVSKEITKTSTKPERLVSQDLSYAKLILLTGIEPNDPERNMKIEAVKLYLEFLLALDAPEKETDAVISFLKAVGVDTVAEYEGRLPKAKSYYTAPSYYKYDEEAFRTRAKEFAGFTNKNVEMLTTEDIASEAVYKLVQNINLFYLSETSIPEALQIDAVKFMMGSNGLLSFLRHRLINTPTGESKTATVFALYFFIEVIKAMPVSVREKAGVDMLVDARSSEVDILIAKEKEKDPELKRLLESCKNREGKFDTREAIKKVRIRVI